MALCVIFLAAIGILAFRRVGTYGIAGKRNDRKIRFYSDNFSGLGVMETSLDDLVRGKPERQVL